MNSNPYEYEPLDGPNAIRLIAIQPAVDVRDLLDIVIFHASLNDSPDYAALSYVWNDEEPWRLVDCNSSYSILVTPNCYAALTRLRLRKKLQILWVDAICINQADIRERNSQVSMMIDIYRSADRTFVWLGDNDSGSDRALDFARRASFFYRHSWLRRLLLYNGNRSFNNLGTGCPSEALSSLANHSYWTRMWTVQEFAASIPIIFWGKTGQTSGVGALRAVHEFFENHSLFSSGSQFNGLLHWRFGGVISNQDQTSVLSHQYVNISRMDSTDERDKVFALKGLYPVTLKELKVDYGQSAWDVYTEATRLTMTNEKSLYLLKYVAHQRDETRSPSWSADWNHKLPYALSDHQASKGSRTMFQFSRDDKVLQLFGVVVDEISDHISCVFPEFDTLSLGFVFQGKPIDIRIRGRTCLRIIFDFYQQKCKSRYPDFGTYFRAIVKFLDPTNKYDAATPSIITHVSEGREHSAMSEIGEYETPFLTKLNGTVLFMTADDRIGVAQRDGIQQSDRIAIVAGLGNPLVLRPAANDFLLISSSVVSGLMAGELWPEDETLLSQLNIV